ncbi:hypothetical protein EAE96_003921 [Botrytis aclada]|nr:hypothetical protein EAE96_003921 [Botrytis aclada]
MALVARPTEEVCIAQVTFSSKITIGYNMADITGHRRSDPPYSRPGSLTLSEVRTQSLSEKREVGRSFSSRDSADLSATIQDPDERAAIRSQVFAGGLGGGGGPGLPGTGDGEIDLSDIGRPAQDPGRPSPKPAEAGKGLNFVIPPPAKPENQALDISQFRNPDGSYDLARMGLVASTRLQTAAREARAARRAERARGSTVPVPAMKPLDTTQATTPLGKAGEARPLRGGTSGGRGAPRRRLRGSTNLSPIAERSSLSSKETENFESQKKSDLPGGSEEVETGKADSDKGKQPTVEGEKADRPAAVVPVADDEGSLYSASPPRSPVQKPRPHDLTTSPGQSEKYRRWAAEPTESPTLEEKFKEWVDRGRSSESKTAAQELEAWAQNDRYDAREKDLAWLFERRSAATRQLKSETEKSKTLQLRDVIIKCTNCIKQAIRLEDRRQNRNVLRKNVELETNPLVKARFQELLQELDRQIERDEKVEEVRLQIHLRPDFVWKKALDVTPAERAALGIQTEHHFAAPAQQLPPMALRESFAEQLLRDKWEKEDALEELEDLLDHIGKFSDSEERDTYWEAFQDIRRPILFQRKKELTDLWKQQAEEVKANWQDAWVKSEAEAEKKLLKLRQVDKPAKEEEAAKKRQLEDALAVWIAKKKVEDAKVEKTIEDIEGVPEMPSIPPVAGQKTRLDLSGLVAALRAKGVLGLPEPSAPGEKVPGRKGLLSVRTVPKGAGDGVEAETAVTVGVSLAPKDSTETKPGTNSTEEEEKIPLPEPRPLSPFRAEHPLSPIQEKRSSITFETAREVADFLEYMAMVRHNEEVVRTGEGELIDPELMEMKEKRVINLGPIDAAEEEKSQKRIQVAERRLGKIIARLMMPKEELEALEEKERQQRKKAKEKKDVEDAAAWEAERLRKQELEDKETARGKAEAEEKKKEEDRKRDELAKEPEAEKEGKKREKTEMENKDKMDKKREEKATADQIARDKIAKDLKDKEDKKKPDVPMDFAEDILTKIKNDLLRKAAGVDNSRPVGEVNAKPEKKDLDDYMKSLIEKFQEEERVRKKIEAAQGKGKPEENPPVETEAAKKARIEKENAKKKDLKDARAKNEEALAKKKLEAEAAKDKPAVDYVARDKADRLAREKRERDTKERDRLAQERADELKNRPEPTAEQKAEAEAKRAKLQKIAQDKEDEQNRLDKIEQEENEKYEREARDREKKDQAEEAVREKNLADARKAEKPGAKKKKKEEDERLSFREKKKKLAADLKQAKNEERLGKEAEEKKENERISEERKTLAADLERKKSEDDKLLEEKKKAKADQELDEEVNRMHKALKRKELRDEQKKFEDAEQSRKSEADRVMREMKDHEDTEQSRKSEEGRLARERIAKKTKEMNEKLKKMDELESEKRNPDLRKARKEDEKKKDKKKQEAAAVAAAVERGGFFQNLARRLNFPDLSWATFRGPTHLDSNPPVPADYELAPEAIAWMHAYASEDPSRRKISLNLTIFSSATQHLSGALPPHYLVCHVIPVLWNVSQLKRHLLPSMRRTKVGEKKTMSLRIERRWLKNGSMTLLEEGFRDWESVVVVMVEKGEDVKKGDWKECIREADGMAGWIEGWPGKGELKMPGDREAWLAEEFKGAFKG